FVKACDEFLYLRSTARARGEAKPGREGDERGRTSGRRERGRGARPPAAQAQVPDWAKEVVRRLVAGASGPLNPSFIKEALVRKEPDFDERDLGFSTFFRMLEALRTDGLIKLQQLGGRQWYALPPEGSSLDEDEESIPDPEDDLS